MLLAVLLLWLPLLLPLPFPFPRTLFDAEEGGDASSGEARAFRLDGAGDCEVAERAGDDNRLLRRTPPPVESLVGEVAASLHKNW